MTCLTIALLGLVSDDDLLCSSNGLDLWCKLPADETRLFPINPVSFWFGRLNHWYSVLLCMLLRSSLREISWSESSRMPEFSLTSTMARVLFWSRSSRNPLEESSVRPHCCRSSALNQRLSRIASIIAVNRILESDVI